MVTHGSRVSGPPVLVPALRELAHELVNGDFARLEADGRAGELSAEQLRTAATRYPVAFVDLPAQAFEPEFSGAIPLDEAGTAWAVDLAMWTQEGRSDLTREVVAEVTPEGVVTRIRDRHVM